MSGKKDRTIIPALVENIDLMPTLFDFLGIDKPNNVIMQVKSFFHCFKNANCIHKKIAFAQAGQKVFSIMNHDYHFILNLSTHDFELYNIKNDGTKSFNIIEEMS